MSRSGGGSHTKRLYVGRIPGRATEDDVDRFFRPIVKPRQVLLKNGFAFVEMDDQHDAEEAIRELDGRALLGERVSVQMARLSRNYAPAALERDRHPGGGYRAIIDNLSSRATMSELKRLMEEYGRVLQCERLPDDDRRARVEFEDYHSLMRALERCDGYEVAGRRIRCFMDRSSGDRRSRSRSHSRSRSRSRSRDRRSSRRRSPSHSRSRSRDRSRSRSRSVHDDKDKKDKKDKEEKKSASKSASPKRRKSSSSRSPSKSPSHSRSRSHSHSSDGGSPPPTRDTNTINGNGEGAADGDA
jgi:arginine/serine-rich splicing factor 4/5/6